MALYQKVDGVWTLCKRAYVKSNGVYTSVSKAYAKSNGTWHQAYNYDKTPPNPPEIDLNIVEDFDVIRNVKTLVTRRIRMGIRLPGSANDPDCKLIRVLTDYAGAAPTTPLGGTYTSKPDNDYPYEGWSDFRYNQTHGHPDTSVLVYKQWPLNVGPGYIIKGDTDYHFTAWSQDALGNWSHATPAKIHVPKASVDVANIVIKEAYVQPDSSGSWRSTGFQSGVLVQQDNPRSQGLWFYGNQFTDSIGTDQTKSTVRVASIYIKRENDTGVANANIYLFRTAYGAPSALPAPGSSLSGAEVTKIGTLAKGQGAWFDLPVTYYNNLNTGIKGLGLAYKDPVKAGAFPEDYSQITSVAANLRVGEVHLVWEQQL